MVKINNWNIWSVKWPLDHYFYYDYYLQVGIDLISSFTSLQNIYKYIMRNKISSGFQMCDSRDHKNMNHLHQLSQRRPMLVPPENWIWFFLMFFYSHSRAITSLDAICIFIFFFTLCHSENDNNNIKMLPRANGPMTKWFNYCSVEIGRWTGTLKRKIK